MNVAPVGLLIRAWLSLSSVPTCRNTTHLSSRLSHRRLNSSMPSLILPKQYDHIAIVSNSTPAESKQSKIGSPNYAPSSASIAQLFPSLSNVPRKPRLSSTNSNTAMNMSQRSNNKSCVCADNSAPRHMCCRSNEPPQQPNWPLQSKHQRAIWQCRMCALRSNRPSQTHSMAWL